MTRMIFGLLTLMVMSVPSIAQTPVKIGMITTLSTPGGYLGEDMRDGFMLAIKEGGGKLGGVPVELVVADDGLNPTTGKTIAERMLQQDKIKLFTGSIFTAVTLAIIPDVLRANAFFINNNNGPKEYDGANCQPNYFASAWQNDASAGSAGVAANESGAKRVVTIAANYYTGLEFVNSFKKNFKGQVADQILVKLNQTDYAAEISQIKALKPDGIYSFLPGGMGISFLRQLRQAGVQGIKIFPGTTIDGRLMQALGDAGKDVIGSSNWVEDLDNPANKKFVAAYRAEYKRVPTVYAASGYDTAQLIGSALKKVNGNLDDADGFRKAILAAEFDSVRGKIAFGKSQTVIQDWYMTHYAVNDAKEPIQKTSKKIIDGYTTDLADQCVPK